MPASLVRLSNAAVAQVLLKEDIIVICAGGGGVPVVFEAGEDGKTWRRHGVEAVIDKVNGCVVHNGWGIDRVYAKGAY